MAGKQARSGPQQPGGMDFRDEGDEMAKRTLQELAAGLRGQLLEGNGYRALTLGRGLEVVLSRVGQQWCLTLKRAEVAPSAVEVRVCREAFGVAEGSEARVFVRNLLQPKTGTVATYHGVALQWREVA
jgi:hypothetical protein